MIDHKQKQFCRNSLYDAQALLKTVAVRKRRQRYCGPHQTIRNPCKINNCEMVGRSSRKHAVQDWEIIRRPRQELVSTARLTESALEVLQNKIHWNSCSSPATSCAAGASFVLCYQDEMWRGKCWKLRLGCGVKTKRWPRRHWTLKSLTHGTCTTS